MARLSFANAVAGILNAFGAGGQLRAKQQLAVTVDALLQMVGNANVAPGNTEQADPLNSPFTIYINPYIGSDRFVGGSFNWFEEPGGAPEPARIAAKLKRLENQRLTCGYSKERPFRTINRAAIEIVAMTSKSFFTINSEAANVDCPSVELSAGTHIFYNDPGNSPSAIPISEWPADGFEPTWQHLIAFNPNSGGIVLPRYATASAPLSLRQTAIRPSFVPAAADEALDYSNRAAILKITSTSYVYGCTFRDQLGAASSHHLLDCFHNASQADLDQLYAKVRTAMGGANNTGNLSNALAVTRPTEWQTVGPITGNPAEAWDTVKGASPYIYNCSLRTEWGMSGVFWDGARLAGLKSLVAAQFTGISQQRDLSCWEVYSGGTWRAPVNYQELIDSDSDSVRMRPRRMSRHITLLNDAFGQLVSVFAIGAGRHHFADSGAQMEFSNSTSNFGGCVAVARGYQTSSVALDTNWNLSRLKVARSVADQTGNVRRIQLGIVSAISSSSITLQTGLAPSEDPAVPAVLAAGGFSLPAGTLVWIENPTGADWRATLASNAWSSASPTAVGISGAALQAGTGDAIGQGLGGVSLAIGRRVYVRRLIDTRSRSQRRVSLKLSNTTSARVPLRNSILQTRPGVSGGGISRALAPGGAEVLAVTQTDKIPAEGAGVLMSAEITLRRSCPDVSYASGVYYRQGQTVKHGGKHFTARSTFISSGASPDEARWQESYVQQESAYNAEEPPSLEAPVLVFDTDTDGTTDATTTCGINWSTVYTTAGSVRDQLRSATDYRGALALLQALGFSSTAAHDALVPRPEASRELDPASAIHFPTAPSGGAASGRANWALEFRLPSFIQLLGHNFNGVGFWNYSRALPRARRQMSALNEFHANFTPEQGGRVEVRGINKDGFEVTNQGLINTDTGEVTSVEGIGQDGDQVQPTELQDLSVENLTVNGTLNVSGVSALEGGDAIAMRTDRFGVGRLANTEQLTAIGSAAPTASDDAALNAQPELVTIGGLNRWRQAQRLVSSNTDTITIFVKAGSADRSLSSMLDNPPTSAALAVPTLARAAEYANTVIGAGNQTADIRIAPGLYDPTSVWQCSVRLIAYNADLTALQFPSNIDGDAVVENNYFDGSGYGDLTNRVNFITFTLNLQKSASSGSNININIIGRQMRFARGGRFLGGFHFLGLPELIKLVNAGTLAAATFVTGTDPLPSGAFTSDTVTNSDTFLNQLRVTNSLTGTYIPWTTTSPLRFDGSRADVVELFDCMFGPVFPSRKDSASVQSAPYIATNDAVQFRVANIYLRGNVVLTSAGTGITAAVLNSGQAHYGTASVPTPWTWRQFHHTFIGPATDGPQSVFIQSLGGRRNALYTAGDTTTRTWFRNNTKYLPNHIHLLDSTGAEPSDNTNGPFLDQFIHAYGGLSIGNAFRTGAVTASFASPVTEGFVGKFGANGYNTVKTRGVLLGNAQNLSDERGSVVFLQPGTTTSLLPAYAANSIFKLAGVTGTNVLNSVPAYVQPATVTAGSFVVARQYEIVTAGTTNFTLIGAADSNVGTVFTATGAGTGTGTARPTGFGQPVTVGPAGRRYNQVITTEANNGNGTPLGLNVALVSYARGISPEHGLSITPNVVI